MFLKAKVQTVRAKIQNVLVNSFVPSYAQKYIAFVTILISVVYSISYLKVNVFHRIIELL